MKVQTYCAGCGRAAEAPNRKALREAGWTVEWGRVSKALFVQCAECTKKWLMGVIPEVQLDILMGGEHPMQHRRLYRAVPLSLFVVASSKAKRVVFAWDAKEAVWLARQEGWFGKTEPVEVQEFRRV